ncbi:SsrA-binding protein [Candidatus Uzinura diaspidicola str. ASNER]|uniref:SsrA-binding protein n=1 Tax=Candidatus Uzinura diaspidicola str. ASNER TaxID=1133592 RepID=L7VJK9_9FLAO|nr:SsrA-binding protein [Candidatus Uzinura diaspidicola str. ASNER]
MYKEILFFNRKALFNYDFFESYIAGIQLFGTEIKSIRLNKVSISESFCKMQNNELYIINMFISKYEWVTTFENYSPRRDRKLLMKSSELRKIECKIKKYRFTIIPTKLFINKKGYAKLKIVLAKGRKLVNKRDIIKYKEIERDIIN